MFETVKGFCNKLSLLKTCLEQSDLSQFPPSKNPEEELKRFWWLRVFKPDSIITQNCISQDKFQLKLLMLVYNATVNSHIDKYLNTDLGYRLRIYTGIFY
jgi:hypothetical protein